MWRQGVGKDECKPVEISTGEEIPWFWSYRAV